MSATYHEPAHQDYAKLGRYVAALLGANEEWDSAADYLDAIVEYAEPLNTYGKFPPVGDRDTLAFWREIADEVGIEHDGEGDE